MEVLNLIRLFWGWVFPYINLTYSLYSVNNLVIVGKDVDSHLHESPYEPGSKVAILGEGKPPTFSRESL